MQKPMTIKAIAQKIGVSEGAVKNNIVDLLAALPIEKRVVVLEYMLHCKRFKHQVSRKNKTEVNSRR